MRDAGLLELPGGEPRALQVRARLVDPDLDLAAGVVGGLDHAERGPELAARQRPGVAVGQDPQRAVHRDRQRRQPELGEPAVVGGGLEDDGVGFRAQGRGDDLAVLRQLADLLVARHDPVHRPAQVDRRRAGVDERVRGAAERRAAGVRLRVAHAVGGQRQADRRRLADGRRTADDHLADRVGDGRGGVARMLDEHIGQPPLVDQQQGVAVHPEGAPEAGRRCRNRGGRGGTRRIGVEDRACRLRRHPLEDLRGTHDRRRPLDELPGELAEEASPPEVGARVVRARVVRAAGRPRAPAPGHSPERAAGRIRGPECEPMRYVPVVPLSTG